MENEQLHTTNATPEPPKRDLWASINKILPFAQWILMTLIGIAVFAIGFRDSQTSQAQTIRDIQKDYDSLSRTVQSNKAEREKQLQDMNSKIVTRELFEERTKAIQDEQIRQRQILERILEQNRISLSQN